MTHDILSTKNDYDSIRRHMLKRARAVQRYLKNGGGMHNALKEANRLGLSRTGFRRLVDSWREHEDPMKLPGAPRQRYRHTTLTPEQIAVLKEAISLLPDANKNRIGKKAQEIGVARGIAMPNKITIFRRVGLLLPPRLPSNVEGKADYLLDHTMGDFFIPTPEGGYRRPILSLLIDLQTKDCVGLAASLTGPDTASAKRALIHALSNGSFSPTASGNPTSLLMAEMPDEEGAELISVLQDSGVTCLTRRLSGYTEGRTSYSLFSNVPGTYFRTAMLLQPKKHVVPTDYKWLIESNVMSLESVEQVLRSRICTTSQTLTAKRRQMNRDLIRRIVATPE